MAQSTQPSIKRIVEALSEDQSENAWGNAAAGFIRTLEDQAKPGETKPTDERESIALRRTHAGPASIAGARLVDKATGAESPLYSTSA